MSKPTETHRPAAGVTRLTARERRARYARAREALARRSIADHEAGIIWETPSIRELRADLWQAEDRVPRWRQRLIARRVLRGLDYAKRMGRAHG